MGKKASNPPAPVRRSYLNTMSESKENNKMEKTINDIMGKHSLLEYVRDGHRQKIGVMYAFSEDNNIYIGWSKCRVKGDKDKRDKFDKIRGFIYAWYKAYEYFDYSTLTEHKEGEKSILPHSMNEVFDRFILKCIKYYTKNENNFRFPQFTILAKTEKFPLVKRLSSAIQYFQGINERKVK